MIAVNNRVRKLASSLFLVAPATLMANQHAASDRPSSRLTFRVWFCCRSKPSVCSDLPEVYLIESGRPCPTSRSTACSTRGSIRACARECRNAESPNPAYQTSPKVSAVPPGDNGRDQIASQANRKKYCDTCRRDLGIQLWFPPLSAGAPERTSN